MQDIKTSLFLAIQAIRRGARGTTAIVVVIMALSVLNLIFMPSILDNMSSVNFKTIIDKQYGHVAIEAKEKNTQLEDAEAIKRKVLSFSDVAGVTEQYTTGATVTYKDSKVDSRVFFINPEDEKTVTSIYEDIREGDYLSKNGKGEVLIGSDLAGKYDPILLDQSLGGVNAGEKIEIDFGNGINRTYKIAGIYKTGDVNTDYSIYIPYSEMESLYGYRKDPSLLKIKLYSGDAQRFINDLQSVGVGEDIYDPVKRNGFTLAGTFDVLKIIMGVIAFMVSGITLFIVVYINALSKQKLIATMKAIGINKRIIVLSFILQSFFYALLGVVIGLGIILLVLVPYFQANPLSFPIGYVSLVLDPISVLTYIGFFLTCSVIAGFIPAYQVANQNITETMRK